MGTSIVLIERLVKVMHRKLYSPSPIFKLTSIHSAILKTVGLVLASGLITLTTSAYAEDETIELDTIQVLGEKESDTRPVKGYNAKKSSSSTRTDTPLRDTPQSISVIPQDLIKDQSIQSISQAVQYVPGVQAAQGEGNRDALVFRGNATTGDFFLDGLRDDVQTYRDIYNTDRIEVLKGPNGMAFGRGGAGGAINRVTKEAGWDPISELTASYGAYDFKRISGDFGQALTDEVAFRLNAVYEDSGSYRDGVNIERYGFTPTFTILPDDKTKIVLSAEYFQDKRVADRGVPSQTGGTGATANLGNRPYRIGDEDTFFGNARLSPTETETVAFNARVEHIFDNGIGVKNSTRYAFYDKYYQNVFARSPVSLTDTVQLGAYRDETKRENLINQTDITYTLNTGSLEHKLLAGAEFSVQNTDNKRLTPVGGENLAPTFSASNPFVQNVVFDTPTRNQKSDITVAGFYLQDQITFSPKWQAILGLRHDNFDTDFTNLANNTEINVSDNLLSPRAGLIFKPLEPVSLYANYSVSYVPRAGDQLISIAVNNASLKPEKFINYELGAKWDINPSLAFTAAIYKLERENLQVADPNAPGQQTVIDGQETKGIELGLTGNITDKWSVFGGVTFQDGKITKDIITFNNAGVRTPGNDTLSGSELAQTPDRTLSLWNKYEINDMWAVALGVVSVSERLAALPTATTSTVMPGYTRYDAAVFGKLSDKLHLQFNIENLTNKEYALYAHNNNNITPGSPITGRATLIYNF